MEKKIAQWRHLSDDGTVLFIPSASSLTANNNLFGTALKCWCAACNTAQLPFLHWKII
jgi:hypothetical protein